MTNLTSLTGAFAFLSLIAVLDNFIFVETDPDFDEMLLVATEAAAAKRDANDTQESGPAPFWIDKHAVSHLDFAKFAETQNHQGENAPEAHSELAASGIALLNESHTLDSAAHARVSLEEASAYCDWLGKSLPSELQLQYASKQSQEDYDLSNALKSLHHAKAPRKSWIGGSQRKGLVIDASAARNFPASHASSDELLGFLCVKNFESVED